MFALANLSNSYHALAFLDFPPMVLLMSFESHPRTVMEMRKEKTKSYSGVFTVGKFSENSLQF